MIRSIIYPSLCAVVFCSMLFGCSQQQHTPNNVSSDTVNDSSCTITDPNNTKPMALAMRTMAANAEQVKSLIAAGTRIDTTNWPVIRFSLVQPTDPNVLEPLFFENASKYYEAHAALFSSPDQATAYNTVIDACVNCHRSYCSGPLKKIRKLYLK